MKIATWNVNSIRARLDRVLAFLERQRPDVVCIQETKAQDHQFPLEEITQAGYRAAFVGQKTYNGVAILSRKPASDVVTKFDEGGDDSDARFISGVVDKIRVVNVYVPNGKEVGHEKYDYKLQWLGRLREWLDEHVKPTEPVILCGDFNVAPADIDVHDPEAWEEKILCSTPERKALRKVTDWGLVDSFRHLHPEEKVFSWWDYRRLGFQKNLGLRIDFLLLTEPLLKRCTEAFIEREERKGSGASDHAPVFAVLE